MNPDFTASDTVLAHLTEYVGGIDDNYLKSRYTGFVAVTAVTSYEVNIRNKIFDFCRKKHKVFGDFSEAQFEKTNAKVKLAHLKDEYLKRFGGKYLKSFQKRVDLVEKEYLAEKGISLKNSYHNLITWRNDFVHEGVLPAYATYDDAREAYEAGKKIVSAFFDSLHR